MMRASKQTAPTHRRYLAPNLELLTQTPAEGVVRSVGRGQKQALYGALLNGVMGSDQALFMMNELVWTALIVGGPIMLGTLIVGLIISIFQVATQIQEITLSYVPKLLAAAMLLMLLGSWMLGRLNQFATTLFQSIPSLSG